MIFQKGGSGGIINKVYTVFDQVFAGEANWYDFAVGASGIAFLVALKLFGKYAGKIHPSLEGSKAVWFIGVSKNTFLIIIMMIVAACTETEEWYNLNFRELGALLKVPNIRNKLKII